jgi:hypothetical protein
MDCISVSWYAGWEASVLSLNFYEFRRLAHFASYFTCRAGCLKILMTPTPGSGPKEADRGITTEVMRATMAATGGRNQRRIANLKTATKEEMNKSDSGDDVLLCSIREQKTISYHIGWSNENDRLDKLCSISDGLPDITDEEKLENRMSYYKFLKRPAVAPEATTTSSSKRNKATHLTPAVSVNRTPASAATLLSTDVETSPFPVCTNVSVILFFYKFNKLHFFCNVTGTPDS